jgi:hypothetical protein
MGLMVKMSKRNIKPVNEAFMREAIALSVEKMEAGEADRTPY